MRQSFSRLRSHLSTLPSWLKISSAVLAIYTLVILITSAQSYLCQVSHEIATSYMSVFVWESTVWFSWAGLTPIMLWTSNRHSVVDRHWYRSLAVHVPVSLLLGSLYLLFYTTLILNYENASLTWPLLWSSFSKVAFEGFHIPLILYWATVGIYDLAVNYRRFANRRSATSIGKRIESADEGSVASERLTRIVVKELGRVSVLDVADIDWIEAADYYSRIHVGARSYLIRKTMNKLESQLDHADFFRTHRSAIVNLRRIKALRRSAPAYAIQLVDGTELKLSRSRHSRLRQALGQIR